jgi:hypothetical protein
MVPKLRVRGLENTIWIDIDLLIASDAYSSRSSMLVEVKLSLQKLLDLSRAGVKLNPLLVDRLGDPVGFNSADLQPVVDRAYSFCGGCE